MTLEDQIAIAGLRVDLAVAQLDSLRERSARNHVVKQHEDLTYAHVLLTMQHSDLANIHKGTQERSAAMFETLVQVLAVMHTYEPNQLNTQDMRVIELVEKAINS